ncbi:MAG: SIS domain-containing protein [Patescibacteria group bacterium]|nr:SIS domain-containing protein [Patescibacteria group bacterium]MDE2589161.1 SIS domain-containing protein [Patescibacteria group bacterium]
MIDLTNLEQIKQLDPKDVYGSTGLLAAQCKQIWQDAKSISYPQSYQNIQNIIICGMGGSAYGGHVAKALCKEELLVPLYVNSDYSLPKFVNEKTLVILTSYSGSTEETLSNAAKAKEAGAQVTVLTSGGKLGQFAKDNNLPSLIFNAANNPSGQPRLGTGYIVLGTLAILNQLGLITLADSVVETAIAELEKTHDLVMQQARSLAQKIQGHIPVIFAAEFLEGNAHIVRNQFNETSKSFSAFSDIPELNHHLMEGLKNPSDKKLTIVFINSSFYWERIAKRVMLTKDVVEKNNVPTVTYDAQGSNKLSQVFNVLSLGGYLTLYLGLLYELDPSLIPWVDYFKEQLAK